MSFDLSINWPEMWRRNQIPTQSVKVVHLRDLALMYELEDFLIATDETLRLEQDIDLFLLTKTKQEIFYYAVTLVTKRHGIDYHDRFFTGSELVPLPFLKDVATAHKPIYTPLDSLYGLLQVAHIRCRELFQHLMFIESKKQYFLEVVRIFMAVYQHLEQNIKHRHGPLHTKALLTTLSRQSSKHWLRRHLN